MMVNSDTTRSTAIQVTGVACVGVPVRDQDRAIGFYVGTLGFEKQLDVPTPGGGRWITVAPPGATATTLALVAASDKVPAGVETGVRLMTGDAEAAHAGLRSRGVDVDDVLRWPAVPPMFAFRDPDGNGLELVESPA